MSGWAVNDYLGLSRREVPSEGRGIAVGRAPVVDHLRGHDRRGMRTGALLALVDATGGFACGLAVLPRWIVSTSIHLQVARLDHAGPLRLDASVLRQGASSVVASVVVVDEGAGDAHVANGLVSCAALDPSEPPRLDELIRVEPRIASTTTEPLETFFAVDGDDAAVTRLQLAEHLRNTWGILHGGATSVLLDVAAARAAAVDGGATADTVVHFLAPVRVGPAEARCTVVGDRPDGRLVRVAVHDTGNADRLCVLASVVVQRP